MNFAALFAFHDIDDIDDQQKAWTILDGMHVDL